MIRTFAPAPEVTTVGKVYADYDATDCITLEQYRTLVVGDRVRCLHTLGPRLTKGHEYTIQYFGNGLSYDGDNGMVGYFNVDHDGGSPDYCTFAYYFALIPPVLSLTGSMTDEVLHLLEELT